MSGKTDSSEHAGGGPLSGPLPKPNVSVLTRPGRDPVIVDKDYPAWATVNETGLEILSLMDGKRDAKTIARTIARRYSIQQATALEDVQDFVRTLMEKNFLQGPVSAETQPTALVTGLFLHLTEACNLACKHCYLSSGPGKTTHLETKLIFRLLDQLAERGKYMVTLSGGEPLMHPDIYEIFEYIGDRLKVRLLTNGILANDRIAGLISEMECVVQFSMDGSRAQTHDAMRGPGAFEATLRAVELFTHHDLLDRLNFCTVVTRDNIDDLFEIARLTRSLNVPWVRFVPMRPWGTAAKAYSGQGQIVTDEEMSQWFSRAFYELAKEIPDLQVSSGISGLALDLSDTPFPMTWCPAIRSLNIDATGNMYPCALFMDPEHFVGNAAEISLADADRNPARIETTRMIRERPNRIEKCRDCMWKSFCQSACSGMARIQNQTVWDSDRHCEVRKKLYEDMIFLVTENLERMRSDPEFDDA